MAEGANVGDIYARLRVDATEWQRGLTQAQQQLVTFQQSVGRLSPSLSQVQQAMTGVNQAATQMGQQLQTTTRATSAWSNALQIAGGIGLATSIGAMTTAIVAFGRETVQTGARLEQLRASLSAIAGSTAAGQQQFQFLTQTAQRLGVTLEPIARGWRTLTAAATQANLPLADQQRLLTALATEARRVGASNEELNRAIIAVSQSASKGKLSMEELRQQLGEALPTAFAAVARGMGRTTEELEKLIETGSVRFPAFARALTRGFEQMQAASGQMAETSQAAFNRLANAWTLLQDTIMKSGLNTYLGTVANNLREAVEWTTKLAAGRAATIVGPSIQDLGATPQQQQEVDRLNRVIATLEARQGAGTPVMQETTRTQIQNTIELRDQILASMRATQDQAIEQGKVTAEVNKTNTAQQLQADYVEDVRKKIGELRKAQEDYRKEAALAPERMGRPGTEEFIKGMEQVTRTQAEALTKLVAQPPQGVTVPADLRQELAAVDTQLGQLERTRERLHEQEQVRRRAEREAAAQAERAISQEISLTAQLARVKAFGARPEESTSAERARQQALQQGVEMQRIVDDAMRQFEQSPALRQRAPQLLDDFTQMQQGLQAAIDTQAMQAFNNAIKQDVIEPLERLAETYGQVKAARDSDKASALEAAAANTIHAARAKELADAIREVAQIEAQIPDLRRQAALSAPAGELAIKRVRDEVEALRVLEENLEQARIPRGGGGFPFGRTREELRLQQRTGEDIRSEEGQRRAQQLQQALLVQERLNYAAGLFADFGSSVGNAWTQALTSIADHTQTVAQAFQEMARSIIQSLGQIAAQEGFKALIGLGVRMIAGAAVGGAGAGLGAGLGGESASAVGAGINPMLFQHGGVIRAPTMAMIGENPAHNPEVILNRQQMQSMFGSSGGQAQQNQGISIHNYPSKAAAEQGAAQQRALGSQAIVNAVLDELGTGESSKINRALRSLQR